MCRRELAAPRIAKHMPPATVLRCGTVVIPVSETGQSNLGGYGLYPHVYDMFGGVGIMEAALYGMPRSLTYWSW